MAKVVVANDHGAVELSARIVKHLQDRGFEVNHLGVKEETSVDYPDMAKLAVEEYRKGGYEFGILCCGTGIGISIAANKFHGIRCALPQNCFASQMAKQHNNANFIAFGGRIDYSDDVLSMVDAYVNEKVSDDPRHVRRRAKFEDIENSELGK